MHTQHAAYTYNAQTQESSPPQQQPIYFTLLYTLAIGWLCCCALLFFEQISPNATQKQLMTHLVIAAHYLVFHYCFLATHSLNSGFSILQQFWRVATIMVRLFYDLRLVVTTHTLHVTTPSFACLQVSRSSAFIRI